MATVQARAAKAPTVARISALAEQAEERSLGDPVTLAEIRELARAAKARAERVTTLTTRLAELTGRVNGGA